MKKFTSVLFLVAFVVVAFAQEKVVSSSLKMEDFQFSSKNYDTLVPYGLTVGGAVLFSTDCGGAGAPGYLAGTNCYGDLAKAQMFLVDDPYNIIGCMVWIGTREGVDGSVTFNIYNNNGNGTALSGAVNYAPGTVLASAAATPIVNFVEDGSMLADGGYVFTLTAPLWVTNDYYTGIDFSTLTNYPVNQIGIVSSEDGSAGATELAWEKWDTQAWYSLQGAGWGGGALDIDLAFFPIVDMNSGIDSYINNIKLNIFPNPVNETATIEFQLKESAQNVTVMVTDITGKAVMTMDLGAQSAGANSVSFDASQFAAGTYVYVVKADRNRLAKQFIVE